MFLGVLFGVGLGFVLGPGFASGRSSSVATAAAAAAAPSVRTLLGPAELDSPGGIALDAAGDLFVADTGHCRVLVLAARASTLDGVRLRPRRPSVLAGGHCTGRGSIGYPSDVAVDGHGDVFIVSATSNRVDEVRAVHSHNRTVPVPVSVPVLGTGQAGFNGDGRAGTATELDHPAGIAVDAAGDVFVADTANCRVRVLPVHSGTILGQAVTAGHVATVAGTGVCGTVGQGGPAADAELWSPVAVTLDAHGDLLVADSGDQSVLLEPVQGGTFYGTSVGAGHIGVVVGGTETYGPYLEDGQPATGIAAELNDPRGGGGRTDGCALRHRRLHAGHPRRARDSRSAARTHHGRGRPLHRGRRAAGEDGVGTGQRNALDPHHHGDTGGHRGVAVGRGDLQRRHARHGPRDRGVICR